MPRIEMTKSVKIALLVLRIYLLGLLILVVVKIIQSLAQAHVGGTP